MRASPFRWPRANDDYVSSRASRPVGSPFGESASLRSQQGGKEAEFNLLTESVGESIVVTAVHRPSFLRVGRRRRRREAAIAFLARSVYETNRPADDHDDSSLYATRSPSLIPRHSWLEVPSPEREAHKSRGAPAHSREKPTELCRRRRRRRRPATAATEDSSTLEIDFRFFSLSAGTLAACGFSKFGQSTLLLEETKRIQRRRRQIKMKSLFPLSARACLLQLK